VRLSDLASGEEARVVAVRGTGDARFRLLEIGLRPGATLRVVQRAGVGGRLVAIDCGRIAIDAETSRDIEVASPVGAS
jgi:ferrous iron transport protein A